jgi:hypothetical protein
MMAAEYRDLVRETEEYIRSKLWQEQKV